MRYVPKKKHLVVNSLSRRPKCKDNSNSSKKNIEEFLDHKLKYLEIYYLLVIVCEGRVRVNFGGIKYRGKAFVNTEKGGDSNKSFKSPGNDFFISGNGNYSPARILNFKLKYSEKY